MPRNSSATLTEALHRAAALLPAAHRPVIHEPPAKPPRPARRSAGAQQRRRQRILANRRARRPKLTLLAKQWRAIARGDLATHAGVYTPAHVLSGQSIAQRALCLVYGRLCNAAGELTAHIDKLAAAAGPCDRRTVQRWQAKMVKRGVLQVHADKLAPDWNGPNRYRVLDAAWLARIRMRKGGSRQTCRPPVDQVPLFLKGGDLDQGNRPAAAPFQPDAGWSPARAAGFQGARRE